MAADPPAAVQTAFDAYPLKPRRCLLQLRKLILDAAAKSPFAGPLTETLKWGEPSYLTERSKSGSTIRIGWKAASPDTYAMYLNCQTNLVDTYRTLFPELSYEGNRAVVFNVDEPLPAETVTACITLALHYHADKRAERRRARA